MRALLAVAALLLTAGCATAPALSQKPADPIFVGTEVKVPVREKCTVTLPVEPTWQVDTLSATATPFERSAAVLAELEQRRDFENQMKAAVKNCE